ncbi:MAG: hypothetical protein Q8N68_03315 [bacterium]|nr:hypothetical protein [bacterium]
MDYSSALQKNILYTLTFFDLMNKPLTLFECWQNLFSIFPMARKPSLSEVEAILEKHPRVESKNGFYFKKGREGLGRERQIRHNFSRERWKRGRLAAAFLSFLPFVRVVSLCNTVAFNLADAKSDIDFFIITKKNKIWTSRFFVTGLVSLLGLRRHHKKIANRVCLSFYLTDDNLNLERIALKNKDGQIEDPYLAFWCSRVSQIYDAGAGQDFFRANSWVKKFLAQTVFFQPVPRCRATDNFLKRFLKKVFEAFLGFQFLEKYLRRLQREKMSRNTQSAAKEENMKVVISEQMLKFYEKDLRFFYEDYMDRMGNKIFCSLH